MFLVQISLLVVTFLSLISQRLPLMQIVVEVNPHPCIAPCVNMWSVGYSLEIEFSICAKKNKSQYVECVILLLMPVVELLAHGFVTLLKKSSGRLICEDGSSVMIS